MRVHVCGRAPNLKIAGTCLPIRVVNVLENQAGCFCQWVADDVQQCHNVGSLADLPSGHALTWDLEHLLFHVTTSWVRLESGSLQQNFPLTSAAKIRFEGS